MKLTMVSHNDPQDRRNWSGTTSNMYDALLKKGFEMDSIVLKNWFTRFYVRGIMFYLKYIKRQRAANFETTVYGAKYWSRRTDKLIRKQKEKSSYYLCPAGASVIAYSKTTKKLVDLPDATYALMNNYYYDGVDRREADHGDEIDRLALKKSNKIIVPSFWAYESVLNDYQQSDEKTSLIPFGANLPAVEIEPRTITKKDINLLLVGVEWRRKGVDIALDVVTKLNANNSSGYNYNLTIVGLSEPNGFTQENITFLGKLDKNDPIDLKKIQEEYEKADLFLLPTQAEAAGIVFAEAAMYALPVITYRTGGVSQYVLNEKTGYTLPKEATSEEFIEKIDDLISHQDKYHKMSIESVRYYKTTLNWDAWATSVENFLKN